MIGHPPKKLSIWIPKTTKLNIMITIVVLVYKKILWSSWQCLYSVYKLNNITTSRGESSKNFIFARIWSDKKGQGDERKKMKMRIQPEEGSRN